MKKALVLGAIVAVLGIGGVGIALMMGADTSDKTTETTSKKSKKTTTNTDNGTNVTVSEDGTVSMGGGTGSKAEGDKDNAEKTDATPRPLNAAELAQQARMKRPFNQHVYNVSSWWGQAYRLTITSDPALATEIQALSTDMREGTRADDANLNATALLDREDALLAKLKASTSNTEMQSIVKYISESVAVTRAGGDPTTVVRPEISGK